MNTQETSLREKALNWWTHLIHSAKNKYMDKHGIDERIRPEQLKGEEIELLYLKEHPQEFPSLLESGEGKATKGSWNFEPHNIGKYAGSIVSDLGTETRGIKNVRTIATILKYAGEEESEANGKLICEAVNNYSLFKSENLNASDLLSEFVKMQNDSTYGDLVWRLAIKEKAEAWLRRNGGNF